MLLVLKFGGTSVGNLERIKNVAAIVKYYKDDGYDVAVVCSAMAEVTNNLISQIKHPEYKSDYDFIVSTGEQVSSGLLASELKHIGVKARPMNGMQVPVRTDSNFSDARIYDVGVEKLKKMIAEGITPVVTGFQGVTDDGRITTIGRGGSDTTAVALAAAISADKCCIYTDVEGVYTADPRIIKDAKKMKLISADEMLEMSYYGAKVMQTRSVELAHRNSVVLYVLSSFVDAEGTLMVDKGDVNLKKAEVKAVISGSQDVLLQVTCGIGGNETLISVLDSLDAKQVKADVISYSKTADDKFVTYFLVKKIDFVEALSAVKEIKNSLDFLSINYQEDVSKISVIGLGMSNHVSLTAKIMSCLQENNIMVECITSSEIRITFVVNQKDETQAIKLLHELFKLYE